MVIELRKDIVPRAAENFRCLCTGEQGISSETGAQLCYKYSRFHTIKKLFMVQGGDIVKNDGSSGESIYGMTFEDEHNDLEHYEGAVGMANFSQPNTNNSQFYICAVDCPHLNDTNIVVGYVLRGLGCITEMEKHSTEDGKPTIDVIVSNCGEILPGESYEVGDDDETEDKLPPFVRDWEGFEGDLTMQDMLQYLECIKQAGNFYYKEKRFVEAARKYKKAVRYYNLFQDRTNLAVEKKQLEIYHLHNSLNLGAVQIKLENYSEVVPACNEALKIDENSIKGCFRRGQARAKLKLYELALEDLKKAHTLSPDNKQILGEFERVKKMLLDYRKDERNAYSKLFQ